MIDQNIRPFWILLEDHMACSIPETNGFKQRLDTVPRQTNGQNSENKQITNISSEVNEQHNTTWH